MVNDAQQKSGRQAKVDYAHKVKVLCHVNF